MLVVTKVNVALLLAVEAVKLRTGGLRLAEKDVREQFISAWSDESIVESDDCACEDMRKSGTATAALQTRQEVAEEDCRQETEECDTVMFVHYHKTGCVLSRQLLDLFFNGNGKAMTHRMEGPLEK